MGDFEMVERVNGAATAGEFLTKNMDFFMVRTTVDITPTGNFSDASQKRFEKLVEAISTRAQPVIMGNVYTTDEVAPVADLPVTSASSGATVTVYNFKFAIEHAEAWDNTGVDLADTLDGVDGFISTIPTDDNNVTVEKWEEMDFTA